MGEIDLKDLKSLYDEKLKDKVKANYTPFCVKISENFDGKNGVLFVGKAENMKEKDNVTIDDAFAKAFRKIEKGWMNSLYKKPTGNAANSAYNRVIYRLAKFLKNEKGINSFARTNLYKLSSTKSYLFSSEFESAYLDIFKKELEILQPKFVIMLTGGLEENFLSHLGKNQKIKSVPFSYKNKGNVQNKKIYYIKIEGFDSIFIRAFHPQGKPEKELIESIKMLVQDN